MPPNPPLPPPNPRQLRARAPNRDRGDWGMGLAFGQISEKKSNMEEIGILTQIRKTK